MHPVLLCFPSEGYIALLNAKPLSVSSLHERAESFSKINWEPSSGNKHTNEFLVKILDSLATICVCDFKNDQENVNGTAIAVALSTGSSLQTLYVAANGNARHVPDHLKAIWAQLRKIKALASLSPDESPRKISPDASPTLHDLVVGVEIQVYKHSFRKFKQRFQKHEYTFQNKFMQAALAVLGCNYPKLKKLSRDIANIGSLVKLDKLTELQWEVLVMAVSVVEDDWKAMLEDKGGFLLMCEGICEQFDRVQCA